MGMHAVNRPLLQREGCEKKSSLDRGEPADMLVFPSVHWIVFLKEGNG